MPEKNRNRDKELEEFLRYTQDQMSDEERNAVERSLQQDPFAAEALEGLSSLSPEEARDGLARLSDRLSSRVARRKIQPGSTRIIWYRMAAAVAVLLVVTSVLFTLFNDRIGQLDRKVAESPDKEKEAPVQVSPTDDQPESMYQEMKAIQDEAKQEQKELPEEEESSPVKPTQREPAVTVLTEPKLDTSDEAELPREAVADIPSVEATEEALARKRVSDLEAEEKTERAAAPLARKEEAGVAEIAAPAVAAERQPAARSRKRQAAVPSQPDAMPANKKLTISGVVISAEDEQPLPGALVALKGNHTVTVTDLNGNFEIPISADSNNILTARFIGMEPQEIPVKSDEEMRISMVPDARQLGEVVVIERVPGKFAQPAGYTKTFAEYDATQDNSAYPGALPEGGTMKFQEYIKENLRFPENEFTLTRAEVFLGFVVGKNGRPEQIVVLRSPGKNFSDEAMRLLGNGPDWEPVYQDGRYVPQSNQIRILFKKD